MKDDFYNRHLTKKNLFDPIIEVFKENGPKYNLLNSAIIELFEFIRKENLRHLVQHVVELYGEFFKTVDYVDTFKLLVLRNDQNQETTSSSDSTQPTLSSNSTNGSRVAVEEDEDYFNTDEDEDNAAPEVPPSTEAQEDITKSFKPLLPKKDDDDLPPVKLKKIEEHKPLDTNRMDNGKKGKISINLGGLGFMHTREEEEDPNAAKKRKT